MIDNNWPKLSWISIYFSHPQKILYVRRRGGVKNEAKNFNIPYLGELPLDKDLRILSDEGIPSCINNSNSLISKIYLEIANKTISSNNT